MINRSIESLIQMLDADYIENGPLDKVIHGVSIDTRSLISGNLYIPLIGERVDGHNLVDEAIKAGASATLWQRDHENPPSDITVILVDDSVVALQQLAKVYRSQLDIKIVGITGSNGKTSSKDILAAMLSTRFITQKTLGNHNNEIGMPLTLLSLSEHTQVGVIEMGMERFHEIELLTNIAKPDIAIITNIGDAHKENLGSIENIAKAKLEIVQGLPDFGLLIYNGDQKLLEDTLKQTDMKLSIEYKTFGCMNPKCDYVLHDVKQDDHGISFQYNDSATTFSMDMFGEHQAMNALSALIASQHLGCSDEDIKEGLHKIEKTGLRNELVEVGTCRILNDSYKSNPQSLHAALETFENFTSPYKIAIVGDMLDLGDDTNLIHYHSGKDMANFNLQEILTIGDLGCYIAQGAMDVMQHTHIQHFQDKKAILKYLKQFKNSECMLLVKGSRALQLDTLVDDFINEMKEENR